MKIWLHATQSWLHTLDIFSKTFKIYQPSQKEKGIEELVLVWCLHDIYDCYPEVSFLPLISSFVKDTQKKKAILLKRAWNIYLCIWKWSFLTLQWNYGQHVYKLFSVFLSPSANSQNYNQPCRFWIRRSIPNCFHWKRCN